MIFEITQKAQPRSNGKKLRVLFIGDTYRAYEQMEGGVVLNDEKAGQSFYPDCTYEEFRNKMLVHQNWPQVN